MVVALPASLQPTYGSTVTISTSASASVGDLKSILEAVTGMSTAEQQLAFGGVALTSDSGSLGGAGIESGDMLTLSAATPSVSVTLTPELHSTFGPTVTVAVRMGAVGMTAAARVAVGTAAVMEVVKGLPRVVAAKTTAGRKAWKMVVAAGGDGGCGVYHIELAT